MWGPLSAQLKKGFLSSVSRKSLWETLQFLKTFDLELKMRTDWSRTRGENSTSARIFSRVGPQSLWLSCIALDPLDSCGLELRYEIVSGVSVTLHLMTFNRDRWYNTEPCGTPALMFSIFLFSNRSLLRIGKQMILQGCNNNCCSESDVNLTSRIGANNYYSW